MRERADGASVGVGNPEAVAGVMASGARAVILVIGVTGRLGR
jgi:hypothetical protein